MTKDKRKILQEWPCPYIVEFVQNIGSTSSRILFISMVYTSKGQATYWKSTASIYKTDPQSEKSERRRTIKTTWVVDTRGTTQSGRSAWGLQNELFNEVWAICCTSDQWPPTMIWTWTVGLGVTHGRLPRREANWTQGSISFQKEVYRDGTNCPRRLLIRGL